MRATRDPFTARPPPTPFTPYRNRPGGEGAPPRGPSQKHSTAQLALSTLAAHPPASRPSPPFGERFCGRARPAARPSPSRCPAPTRRRTSRASNTHLPEHQRRAPTASRRRRAHRLRNRHWWTSQGGPIAGARHGRNGHSNGPIPPGVTQLKRPHPPGWRQTPGRGGGARVSAGAGRHRPPRGWTDGKRRGGNLRWAPWLGANASGWFETRAVDKLDLADHPAACSRDLAGRRGAAWQRGGDAARIRPMGRPVRHLRRHPGGRWSSSIFPPTAQVVPSLERRHPGGGPTGYRRARPTRSQRPYPYGGTPKSRPPGRRTQRRHPSAHSTALLGGGASPRGRTRAQVDRKEGPQAPLPTSVSPTPATDSRPHVSRETGAEGGGCLPFLNQSSMIGA